MSVDRVVDISSEGVHLARERGFLTVTANGTEKGRIPLDDIAAVILNAHGITLSNSLIAACGERGIVIVSCAANHRPVVWLWPLDTHHRQQSVIVAQANAGLPLKKRLWQSIVRSKITMQSAVAEACGYEGEAFDLLRRRVRSGDPDNIEAQAARRYWPLVMGETFRRDTAGGGANGMLNYGYAVIRAAVSRAIAAAGLHPSIGVHHANQYNAFCLADDLMEPFRPICDMTVRNLLKAGVSEVDTQAKQVLAGLIVADLPGPRGLTTLSLAARYLATSMATGFADGKAQLALPIPPDRLALASLGKPS